MTTNVLAASYARKALLLFLCLGSMVFLIAQDPINPTIQAAWEQFANNEFDRAKALFEEALNGPAKAEAYRGLSLVEAATGTADNHDTYLEYYYAAEDPEPYISALWSMGGELSAKEIQFLQDIANRYTGRLEALANQALGFHYKKINQPKKGIAYYEKIGAIKTWQVVGEFENISESGFDKDFGVLANRQPTAEFINKRGVDVSWFDIDLPPTINWVDFEYHFYASNSIMYAQTYCNSPTEQEVQFRLGVAGSVKLWVNDQLLFSDPQERDNQLDSYVFTAKLMKGHNRILIQIGNSEVEKANFLLRITDQNGVLLPGLTYTTDPVAYPTDYTYQSTYLPESAEEYFQDQIAAHPDYLENYLILSQMYQTLDMFYEAKKLQKEAKKRFPNSSYLITQMILTQISDNNPTEASLYLEELKSVQPNGALSLELRFDDAMDSEDYEEAENLLRKIQLREANSVNVYEKRIQLASEKQEIEELFKQADQAYSLYPNVAQFVILKYYLLKEVKKNNGAAVRVLRSYLADHHNNEVIRLLAGTYFDMGNLKQGIKYFTQLVENNPLSTGYRSRLASIYFALGQYNKAEEQVQTCIKIAPYVGGYYRTLGQTYSEMNERSKAIDAYDLAIKYNPYDYEARELRRNTAVTKSGDVFSVFKSVDAYEVYENSPSAEDYPEDNSVILLDEVQNIVYEGGGFEMKQILVVKVFNSSGVDFWKEYNVGASSNQSGLIEKAEVFKANGSRLEAQTDGGYVVFSNLEQGDAIHITYKLQNYYSGKLATHFWDKHFFQYFIPVLKSRYSILVPKNKEFAYEVKGDNIEPVIKPRGKNNMYIWEMDSISSVKYEPYMSNLPDVGKVLHLSSFEDWDFISDWYADLAQAKAKADFEVQEVTTELFAGKEGLTEREKAEAIYNYIVNNIRYSSVPFLQSGLIPQKASRVLSTKQGDCKDVSTLFVAMCKTQGIDANLVLINTRDNGYEEMLLPSIDFNHCIAKVNLEGEDYYLELTSENLPFASGLGSLKRAFSLEIPQDPMATSEATLLNPETRLLNKTSRVGTVSFEGGTMTVVRENYKTGIPGASMRDIYENIGRERQLKDMQEAINDEYPGIKLTDLTFIEGLDNNAPTLHYEYAFEVPSVFTEISGLSIFKLPFSNGLENMDFLSSETREFPIELWEYFSSEVYEESIIIQVPTGMVLTEVPEDETYADKNFEYSMTFIAQEGQLIAKRTFILKDDIVSPEDYVLFRENMNKVIKKDGTQIAFKAI